MDEELTERYCREVFLSMSLNPAVKDLLNKGKIDSVIVPGGCTKYIQAPDVCWNKPMKEYLREMCDLWLADGTHELTAHGNMRAPPKAADDRMGT